ncbi:MAG: hypothetical protein ACHQUA_01535 [Microgenomates group bacterium]
MDTSLAQIAISHALKGSWDEAIKANLEILKFNPEDVDSLNRLARAYTEIGEISKAKQMAQKVLKVDSVNSIAIKCLEKCKSLKKGEKGSYSNMSAEAFLEEPGKTKMINLIHPGDENVLAKLDSGEEVNLLTHPHRVSVVTPDGKYIGRLPDDLAARLKRLIKLGNRYQVLIKSIDSRIIRVFIREMEKSMEARDVPSFPGEKIEYVSFTPPELVHKNEPIMEETEGASME